jgi:hypothetical protein
LNIIVTLFVSLSQTPTEALRICVNETLWQKRLFVLRTSLPQSCKATITLNIHDLYQRQPDYSSLEPELADLAARMQGFEVALKGSDAGSYNISKNGWYLQIIRSE